MLKRHLWQLVFSLLVAVWGVSELLPYRSTPFPVYVRAAATAKPAEFGKLLDEAAARKAASAAAGAQKSEFVALKEIAAERKIDLLQYFPGTGIRLEDKLTNVRKRNDIVLNELLRRSQAKLKLGLDLAGGVSVTLKVDETALAAGTSEADRVDKLHKAVDIIHKRVDEFGVAEPVVRPVGNDQIEIQMPGLNIKDNPDVIERVKKPALLEFKMVHESLPAPGAVPPPNYSLMALEDENGEFSQEFYIKDIPEMTGDGVAQAFARPDMVGRAEVIIQFSKEGRENFAAATRRIVEDGQRTGRTGLLAIVLDGVLYSAPTVKEVIDNDTAQITGNFTDREAMDLANVLNNPLDLPLTVIEQSEVGPTLAQDAIDSGFRSAIIGAALVSAFMITFYTTGGVVAVITLAINVLIILGVMASLGATMTLPGLAGIVLTMGMAVDANILIYERMREELAVGKSLEVANQSGYRKALTTILDAHIVQLIICAIMIGLGTGPIKGFGVTLAVGVLSTLFSVLVTAHLLMEVLIESQFLKKFTMNRLIKSIHVDFVKYGKPAFIGSWIVVLIGVGVIVYKGSSIYGIDFVGGDMVKMEYTQLPDTQRVREIAARVGVDSVNVTTSTPIGGGKETINIATPEGKGAVLADALQKELPQAGLVSLGTQHIGASVGAEIQRNALLAVGVSMLTILVYIAFRFEFGFGVGAMFSSLHDIFMTIGIFVLTGRQFNAPMVAAILCIAGYSINETVVVFDRIREELKVNPTGSLRDVVNAAINKVFARTIMTSTTTFLAALALYIFGGDVLRDISFTFLIGIVTSTFSAIFIAAQVFYWWHKGDRKHVEAHADVAPKYEWQGTSKAAE